jgi:hypothetical protein
LDGISPNLFQLVVAHRTNQHIKQGGGQETLRHNPNLNLPGNIFFIFEQAAGAALPSSRSPFTMTAAGRMKNGASNFEWRGDRR